MEAEISLKDLYRIIKKHLLTILISILCGAVVSVLIMILFVTPKYSSEAQLLVNQQGDSTPTTIQNNEIQANIQLINTYRDIIIGHSVLNQVNNNLNSNYTINELKDSIDVTQSTNSQAFNLTVTMQTPDEAQLILNEIINVFETTIKEVYINNATNIFVLSPASHNANKVSPSLSVYIMIGSIVGLVISFIIVLVIELMDTSIKDDEFLQQLGIINLGRIYELTNKELKQTRLNGDKKQSRMRERV